MPFALTISGLSKTYPNGVRALDGVSLTIPTGMFGLLGPNGAGKSTLMRTLATLQEADAGTVQMGDIDVLRDKAAVRRTLGYLPQDFGVYPKVSAEELLDHLARLKGLTQRRQRSETVATLLRQTNLYDVRRKALGGFSGGMRQRFGIAQALLGNPRLIIVDEPTAGLDPEERVRFHNLLAEIGENVIVILSTHIVSDVSDLCGRMAIINQGRVMLAGESGGPDAHARRARLAEGDRSHRTGRCAIVVSGHFDAPACGAHAGQCRRRRAARAPDSPPSSPRSKMSTSLPSPAGSRRACRCGKWHERVACDRRFEFRTRVKRISTWVYFLVFFALAMLWIAAAGGAVPNAIVAFGSGKVWVNSPYAIAQTVAFLGMAGADDHRCGHGPGDPAGFRIPRRTVLLFGADQPAAIISADASWAPSPCWSSFCRAFRSAASPDCWLPGIDTDRVGPMRLAAYVAPYATMLVPNVVVLGGLFFCIAAMTRRMLPVYIASVVLLIGYLAAQGLLRDIDNKTLAALLDPFGVAANSTLTEYWSISERNTRLVPLEGVLLWNRLLWLGIRRRSWRSAAARFTFTQPVTRRRTAGHRTGGVDAAPPRWRRRARRAARHHASRACDCCRGWRGSISARRSRTSTSASSRSPACCSCIATSTTAGEHLRHQHLAGHLRRCWSSLSGTFSVFMLVIITFYAGELAWRERDNRLDQIHDALPIPTWLPFLGKLLALMLVPVVLQAVLMLCGLGIQTAEGLPPLRARAVRRRAVRHRARSTTGWSACWRSPCIRSSTRSTSATSS